MDRNHQSEMMVINRRIYGHMELAEFDELMKRAAYAAVQVLDQAFQGADHGGLDSTLAYKIEDLLKIEIDKLFK